MFGRNRVVITGLGVLAANGTGKDAFWKSLNTGKSGIDWVTLCDVEGLSSRIAGEVKNFDPAPFLQGKIKPKRLSRNTQLAVSAAFMALEDAGIPIDPTHFSHPLSIVLGISMPGFNFIEKGMTTLLSKGKEFISPEMVGLTHIASASTIADLLGIPCDLSVLSNSCVGGVDAIGTAFKQIQTGHCEQALAGGSDAPIYTSLMGGFCAMRMLSTRTPPEKASAPFDLRRDKGVLAEGSAFLMLESLDHAIDRDAPIYAEIIGYGKASDPTKESASGLEGSMNNAINNAGIQAETIDWICAHAPSCAHIDRTEVAMIKRVFKTAAYSIPVSSIKGSTGNPLAAGGALQATSAALGLYNSTILPTINYEVEDPACDLDHVAGRPRHVDIHHALINSHGLGRINSSLILKKYLNNDI